LVTTGLVWYSNIKNFGFKTWLKGFTEPIAVMTPMNIVSEIANPISMAFRHFGNVAGGSVLTSVIYAALAALSGKSPRDIDVKTLQKTLVKNGVYL
jgi:F-type H+-transporting ATPase subunit a